jgi:hypothetical protein
VGVDCGDLREERFVITLLREEPVRGLELMKLSELRGRHEALWREIWTCGIAVRGDV